MVALKVGFAVETGGFELSRRLAISVAIQDAFLLLGKNLFFEVESRLEPVLADAEHFPEYTSVIQDVLVRVALGTDHLDKAFELACGAIGRGNEVREEVILELIEKQVSAGCVDELRALGQALKDKYRSRVNISLRLGDMFSLLGDWREALFWLENAASVSVVAAALRSEKIRDVQRQYIHELDTQRAQGVLAGALVRRDASNRLGSDGALFKETHFDGSSCQCGTVKFITRCCRAFDKYPASLCLSVSRWHIMRFKSA